MARKEAQRPAQRAGGQGSGNGVMTVAQLEHKLSQNPSSPVFARLADEYLTSGKPAEARALCVSGLQSFPSYATAYIVLARCCEAEGDYENALASVAAAQEILPFAPYLNDLQVDLMSKHGAPAGEEGTAAQETGGEAGEQAEPLIAEIRVAADEPAEPLIAEAPVAADEPAVSPEDNAPTALPESPEADIASPEETVAGDELMSLTPLEDELRRSLEAQLNPARTGEILDDVPPAYSDTGEEISPEAVALPEELVADEIEKEESAEEAIGLPSEAREEAGPSAAVDDAVRPAEMEEFFNERISELQVEGAPEVESPEAGAPQVGAPMVEAPEAVAGVTPAELSPAETTEETTIAESPVNEAPAVDRLIPVPDEKPKYVPPPPVPEEVETDDETTSLGVDGRIVSRTLAEIYVMQGAFAEAILTYQLLKLEKPELRAECEARIRELEPKLQEKSSL